MGEVAVFEAVDQGSGNRETSKPGSRKTGAHLISAFLIYRPTD